MSVADLRYVLPADADVVALPEQDEVLLARRGSRVTPQLLSADTMRLLEHFRTPATLTEAILGYCAATSAEPMPTLDEAFPVLVALTHAGLLVAEGSDEQRPAPDRQRVGEVVGPATITSCVRTLRDSEVWRGELADGTAVIVKIVDEAALGPDLFAREVSALCQLSPLSGTDVPGLVWHEASPTGGTLVTTEVLGDPVDVAVADDDAARRRAVAVAVLDAYAAVHERGVLHGDVHAGNVLLRPDGTATLIDFGLATLTDDSAASPRDGRFTARSSARPAPRAAGGEGLDPQCAEALLHAAPPPVLDAAAEQYAVAALVWRVLTSAPYLDLARERADALQLIVTGSPRRFAAVDGPAWPSGERVLRRALAKSPAERFASVSDLRQALVAAAATASRDGDPAPDNSDETDLRRAVAALDVDGPVWDAADGAEAAHAAWFLERVAQLTGDVRAHDLAAIWAVRADGEALPRPRADEGVARGHRELANYCLTGHDVHLRRARAIATRLGTAPVRRVDVRRGRWASVLLTLECRRPADAVLPGSVATVA